MIKNSLSRFVAASSLAFAAVAGNPVFATPDTSPAQDNQSFTEISAPTLLESCTKDNHAFRVLATALALKSNTGAMILAQDFLKGMDKAVNDTISTYSKKDLTEETIPTIITPAIAKFITSFNLQNDTRFFLSILDYGVTHRPDKTCLTRNQPAPAP